MVPHRLNSSRPAVNYYERHIGDYIRDTAHLSLLEHGIYNRLIDTYYLREGPIPDAEAERLIGARSPAEKKATRAILAEFFQLRDGKWYQTRCEEEIAAYRELVASQSNRGKAGAAARWGKRALQTDSKRDASSMPEACNKHPTSNANAMLGDGLPSPISQKKIPVGEAAPPVGSLKTQIFRLGKQLGIHGGILTPEIERCGESAVWQALGKTLEARPAENVPYFRALLKPRERGFQA